MKMVYAKDNLYLVLVKVVWTTARKFSRWDLFTLSTYLFSHKWMRHISMLMTFDWRWYLSTFSMGKAHILHVNENKEAREKQSKTDVSFRWDAIWSNCIYGHMNVHQLFWMNFSSKRESTSLEYATWELLVSSPNLTCLCLVLLQR